MDIITAKPGYIYIVGYIYRPGCLTFSTTLEHQYYPPETVMNELFNIYMVKYNDMLFNVVELPQSKSALEQCYRICHDCGLRMVPGKPWNGKMEFPLNCRPDACFTLETSTSGHNLYNNRDLRQIIEDEAKNIRTKYCK